MRKILWVVLVLIGIGLCWYLFVKPSDYTIRFEAKTFPGAINQTLKLWDKSLKTESPIIQNDDWFQLEQQLNFNDSIHRYQWQITPLTDSTSKVKVNIRDENHSLVNKIKVAFSDSDFEKRSRKTVMDFMENLRDHTKKFKVTIEGEATIPEKYLAYIPVKCTQFQKAGGMMENFNFISQLLLDHKVVLDGPPMIQVTKWNREQDSLEYNFGHPIIRSEKLPMNTEVQYKRIFPKKAIKATYNGNYITSDRAWYALLNYARKNNIAVENTPVEVFFDNPNMGGDEVNWKAEIYMPLKENP